MITLPFKTTENHIADLSTAITFWHNKEKERFNLTNWQRPVFTVAQLKGTCGGKAEYITNKVMINFALYKENKNDYLWQTVGHEVAHLAAFQAFGLARVVGNPHGAEWATVMRNIGLQPLRCHSMDVLNVKQVRARNRYVYTCPCKKTFRITLANHKKSDNLMCPTCKTKIRFTGQVINLNA
jgi:SprT protein